MPDNKPAYLVACGTFLGEVNPEYSERATGPAQRAGLTPIAGGPIGDKVELLEGELPEGVGFLAIEQFDSFDALRKFWFSEEYQSAIPFRKDSVKMHFVAALDGTTREEMLERIAAARTNEKK